MLKYLQPRLRYLFLGLVCVPLVAQAGEARDKAESLAKPWPVSGEGLPWTSMTAKAGWPPLARSALSWTSPGLFALRGRRG